MSIYLIIYIALSIISVVCAFIAAKAEKFGLMKVFVIFAIAAGIVLALGNASSQSGTVYVPRHLPVGTNDRLLSARVTAARDVRPHQRHDAIGTATRCHLRFFRDKKAGSALLG